MKKSLLGLLAVSWLAIAPACALALSVTGAKEGKLEIEITNDSEKPVYLNQLEGVLIGLRFEVWSLDKGVVVYPKDDAAWRRAQAMVNSKWAVLEAKAKRKLVVNLKETLPASASNDDLAAKILEEAAFLESFRLAAVISYRETPGPEGELKESRKDLTLTWPK